MVLLMHESIASNVRLLLLLCWSRLCLTLRLHPVQATGIYSLVLCCLFRRHLEPAPRSEGGATAPVLSLLPASLPEGVIPASVPSSLAQEGDSSHISSSPRPVLVDPKPLELPSPQLAPVVPVPIPAAPTPPSPSKPIAINVDPKPATVPLDSGRPQGDAAKKAGKMVQQSYVPYLVWRVSTTRRKKRFIHGSRFIVSA